MTVEQADRLRHLVLAGASRRRRPSAPSRPQGAVRVHPASPAAHDDPVRDPTTIELLALCGLRPEIYRSRPMQRRLNACLRSLRVTSPEAACVLLRQKPEMAPLALEAMLVGVTEFFRDPPMFAGLRTCLQKTGRPVRVWSAACSDGSELFSVAMLLDEMALLEGSELVGTDCRASAIESARAGVFGAGATKNLTASRLVRWFEPLGEAWRVRPHLRRAARFEVQDLSRSGQRGPWDVILWRNTAIYLNRSASRDIWTRLAGELRPGGLLVTGKAERPDAAARFRGVFPYVYQKEVI